MSVVKVSTTLPISWKEFEVGEWAHAFLTEGIVACVQIDKIRSMYYWEGQANTEEEWRISITTDISVITQLIQSIESVHPYDTPQIIWSAVNSNENYSKWVKEAIK